MFYWKPQQDISEILAGHACFAVSRLAASQSSDQRLPNLESYLSSKRLWVAAYYGLEAERKLELPSTEDAKYTVG